MIASMSEPAPKRIRGRSESREAIELRAIKAANPALSEAVEMHLELIEIQRRIQSRIPVPACETSQDIVTRHVTTARPLFPFENIPLEPTDLRLVVRQMADVLHRYGMLDDAEVEQAQALGRDADLVARAEDWYRQGFEQAGPAEGGTPTAGTAVQREQGPMDQVMALAMRPFLSRCAEVLQPRPELSVWTHPVCPLCGGEPDLAFITPAADRHLVCSRCTLHWRFEALACPYCRNSDRDQLTTFATPDGQYRVYGCDVCHRYIKAYDGRHGSRSIMPLVDSIATLPLDAAAMQRGYSA